MALYLCLPAVMGLLLIGNFVGFIAMPTNGWQLRFALALLPGLGLYFTLWHLLKMFRSAHRRRWGAGARSRPDA